MKAMSVFVLHKPPKEISLRECKTVTLLLLEHPSRHLPSVAILGLQMH